MLFGGVSDERPARRHMVSMLGFNCNLLPVVGSVSSSSAGPVFHSHYIISTSKTAFPYHPQPTSIVKLLNSVRSLRQGDVSGIWEKFIINSTVCEGHTRTRATICKKTAFLDNSCSLLNLEDDKLLEVKRGEPRVCPKDDLESSDEIIAFKEMLRRERISCKNHGKVPWNKGKKHSPETIELIKKRTSQAMLRPATREKLKRNASKPMGDATKENIKRALLSLHATRRLMKCYQLACLHDWKNQVSEAARTGGVGDQELQWNSYSKLKVLLREEHVKASRAFQRMKKQGFQESARYSEGRNRSISDAIREKWKDQDYRSKMHLGRENYLMTRGSRSNSVKQNIRKSKLIDQMSPNELSGQKQQKIDDRSIKIILSRQVGQNIDKAFVNAVMAGEESLTSKKKPLGFSKHYREDGKLLMAPGCDDEGCEVSAYEYSLETFGCGSFPQDCKPEMLFSRKTCSYVDSNAYEKLEKLRRLQAGRLVIQMKKKEAAERARLLMNEAEEAAKTLEAAAKSNPFVKASLVETRRLLAEAAQSMKIVESKKFNQLAPMQHQNTISYAINSSIVSASSESEIYKSCITSEACNKSNHHYVDNKAEVQSKMPSDSNGEANTFDLIDSWIVHESPERFRACPPISMTNFDKAPKSSQIQPRLIRTSSNAPSSKPVDKESLTLTLHHLNISYLSSISEPSPAQNNCGDRNWAIPKKPKNLKKWHCGRLVTVEKEFG